MQASAGFFFSGVEPVRGEYFCLVRATTGILRAKHPTVQNSWTDRRPPSPRRWSGGTWDRSRSRRRAAAAGSSSKMCGRIAARADTASARWTVRNKRDIPAQDKSFLVHFARDRKLGTGLPNEFVFDFEIFDFGFGVGFGFEIYRVGFGAEIASGGSRFSLWRTALARVLGFDVFRFRLILISFL